MALNIGVDAPGTLLNFGADVVHQRERQWHLDQIRPFLEHPDAVGPALVARYYPQVSRAKDAIRWQSLHLEYGVLELLPGLAGAEWLTFPGHIHRGPGRELFPSVLEVLHGRGGLYLQRSGPLDRNVEASIIWLSSHDRVLLPPGYVHSIINCGDEPLVAAEVHSEATRADFSDAAHHRGVGYYFGPGGVRPNRHYRTFTTVREISAASMAPPAVDSRDLYHAVLTSPERFRFLHPY